MKKMEIIIRPEKLEKLKKLLNSKNFGGLTVMNSMGCGVQKGDIDADASTGVKVGSINLIPKIVVIVVINDEDVEDILLKIHEEISTGNIGDGKVFVYDVVDAMRIRTGKRGKKAI
ncbi:P-II family nitrogen regulator [Treponema primitia]|uniref:P-II family nitrogen regulator n=1 Tax=Treponema primitia TaxID=88058 RepID=UPI003980F2DB